MSEPLRKTYQLKITLKGSKPPIWRRFLVENTVSLEDFHEVVQIIMGWTNSHLHHFITGGQCYGVPDPEFDFSEILDEKRFRLRDILKNDKDSILYEYDFGDGWEHSITLEKTSDYDPNVVLPVCIKASGACPPEDIGGIWGYYNFLKAMKDKNHPEHHEYLDWFGGEFDADFYDIAEVNQRLESFNR